MYGTLKRTHSPPATRSVGRRQERHTSGTRCGRQGTGELLLLSLNGAKSHMERAEENIHLSNNYTSMTQQYTSHNVIA
ncbi:hypothetical protein E2C01_061184 [Portunus trituberculatus]|uniref:Uncharacterized protein n=1 Tax=Portunus trituberculatus TaxID=210409 RepID=A0A5B7HED1_PORTR|nr:hypothetical protein [Portunus trituberculatus]